MKHRICKALLVLAAIVIAALAVHQMRAVFIGIGDVGVGVGRNRYYDRDYNYAPNGQFQDGSTTVYEG